MMVNENFTSFVFFRGKMATYRNNNKTCICNVKLKLEGQQNSDSRCYRKPQTSKLERRGGNGGYTKAQKLKDRSSSNFKNARQGR